MAIGFLSVELPGRVAKIFPIRSTLTSQPSSLHCCTSQYRTSLSSWLNASVRMPIEAASSPHDVLVDCSVLFRRSPLILSPRYAATVLNLDHQWHVRLKGWHRYSNHASL